MGIPTHIEFWEAYTVGHWTFRFLHPSKLASLEYLGSGKWLTRLERDAFLKAKTAAASERLDFSHLIPLE